MTVCVGAATAGVTLVAAVAIGSVFVTVGIGTEAGTAAGVDAATIAAGNTPSVIDTTLGASEAVEVVELVSLLVSVIFPKTLNNKFTPLWETRPYNLIVIFANQ